MFESSQRVDPDAMFPALAVAIAALPGVEPGGSALTAADELRALVVLQRRLQAAVLSRVASFDAQGFALASGAASTAAWVRAYTNLHPGQATSLVAAARTAAALPLLAAELTAGRIGVEHVQSLAAATRQVPEDVLRVHDKTLRDVAPHSTPTDLHRAGQKITEVWDTGAAAEDASHVEDSRTLHLSQSLHGRWALDGTLTPEAGATLTAALTPLMTKRGKEDDRTPGQRRADALLELAQVALTSGQLPDAGGDRTRITLLVHATPAALDQLQHATQPAPATQPVPPTDQHDDQHDHDGMTQDIGERHPSTGKAPLRATPKTLLADGRLAAAFGDGASHHRLLGSNARLTIEALTRLGCDADLAVAVLDATGQPLYLSQSSRDPNTTQRRVLVIRDGGCVFPGCDRPPAHCQAHHLKFWSAGGPTDIDNLALVCGFHHWLVHDKHWTLEALPASAEAPAGGWHAESPDGLILTSRRQPAA